MALSTYADLQTAVAGWLHRGDLAAIAPDLILLGEKRIFREVRCRVMETALSGTTASGVIAVPSDYLELKFAYINDSPTKKLTRSTPDQVYESYPSRTGSGTPRMIAREGSNFIFGPYPADGKSLLGIYYAKPTSIQTSANALFVANPDLYLWAALCESAPYLKDDPRVVIWEAKYSQVKKQIIDEARAEDGSGGGLQVVVA